MALQIDRAESSRAPGVPALPNVAREVAYTWIAIAFTLAFLAIGVFNPLRDLLFGKAAMGLWPIFLDVMVIAFICFYVWGQMVYEWCRLGYLECFSSHQSPSVAELEAIYDRDHASALVVLVPAYCEPPAVLRTTLMSAALLEHPNHTVALLIDNPPEPADASAASELEATRAVVDEIENLLRGRNRIYAGELADFHDRSAHRGFVVREEGRRLAALYLRVAQWLEEQAQGCSTSDHVESLFAERILREPARLHRDRAAEIAARSLKEGGFSEAEALHEYRRLAALFGARVTRFERKRYVNFSHVKNKASNLNSFLGLIGRAYCEEPQPDGLHLKECDPSIAMLRVPDAEYVIICDADSILLRDYALKLLPVMEQPGAERIAVAQVHSLSVPNSPRVLQRIAGNQTNATRVVGHGSVRHGAAFWAGNNALIRRAALQEIEEHLWERGFPIKRYIRDRTLIEDTETTIEFVSRGWKIYSLPDMLAYVGTPADYGALLVQRRRWAGGGLLHIPKLLGYLSTAPDRFKRIPEALLRLHYLGLAAINFGWFVLPILVAGELPPPGWWIFMCLPFTMLTWRDLRDAGCNRGDIVRVQALNMLLVPVAIEGFLSATLGSLRMYLTGHRRTFPRTPKSNLRTPAPAPYALVAIVLPALAGLTTIWDFLHGQLSFAAFGLYNTILLGYALVRFVGPVEAVTDIGSAIRRWRKPAPSPGRAATDGSVEALRA